jgi:uncharacterized protein YjbI with pentapeptide repeats
MAPGLATAGANAHPIAKARPKMKLTVRLAALLAPSRFSPRPHWRRTWARSGSVQRGASCAGCNLFQAELSGRFLPGRNYAQARLRQADLSLSVAPRANFSGADLRDLNAFGAVLSSANFAGADLTNANFVGAHLEGANLRGANLQGVNFSGAEMRTAVGLHQGQLAGACGDGATRLPAGLHLPAC